MDLPCSCSQHAAKRLGAAYISANIAGILHQHLQAAEKETRILVRGLHSLLRVAVEHLLEVELLKGPLQGDMCPGMWPSLVQLTYLNICRCRGPA